MRARIHRGAHEIGGNCVELEAGGKRIVLDLGRPLGVAHDEEVDLPEIPGLASPDDSLLGLILSHPHQDHYGLVAQAERSVPIYIGKAAAAVLEAAAFFTPSGIALRPSGFLENRRPLVLGPFTITPYLVDHSAFDAYALLIEGGGRRLFYSGDVRAHGRKASLVKALCEHPPEGVDVLVLEGTHVRAGGGSLSGPSESGVERELAERFGSTPGAIVVFSAAQNVDRLVTVYRACIRAGRTLVVDLYTATVAAATGHDTIPQRGFPRLRVYIPNRQRVLVKESREFDRVDGIRQHRIFLEEIREHAGELVLLIQGSTLPELAHADCLRDASAVWSLWRGYLDEPSGRRIVRLLKEHGVPLVHLHASGHASVEDLRALAAAMSPARIVPIHTSAPELFAEHFERVEAHTDGEWWNV